MRKPYQDRVLIKPDPDETSVDGIHLLGKEIEKNKRGTVIAVGPGMPLMNLKIEITGNPTPGALQQLIEILRQPIPVPCVPGDRVLFGAYSGTKITLEGIDYLMIRASDLMGEL